MNNSKTITTQLSVLIALVVIIGAVYMYEKRFATVSFTPSTSPTPSGVPYNPGSANVQSTPTDSPLVPGKLVNDSISFSSWTTYTNAEYGLQFRYPMGFKLADREVVGGRALDITGTSSVVGFNFQYPHVMIFVQSQQYGEGATRVPARCNSEGDPNTLVTFNGVTFIRTDTTSRYGGMEGFSIAAEYCVEHAGTVYKITPQTYFAKYAVNTPKPTKEELFRQYDEAVKAMNFEFTER